MSDATQDGIMDIDGLAAYLKLSRSTTYKLVAAGKVPGFKVGKHWRFRRETIDAWLDAQGRDPAPPPVPAIADEGLRARSLGPASGGGGGLAAALTPPQIETLRVRWVETPAQFIAIASTEAGRAGIAGVLGMAPDHVAAIARYFETLAARDA